MIHPQPSGAACDELCELQSFARERLRAADLYEVESEGAQRQPKKHCRDAACEGHTLARVAGLKRGEAAARRAIAHMLMRVGACGGRTRLELRASACGGFGPPHLRAMRVRVAACEAHATSDCGRLRPAALRDRIGAESPQPLHRRATDPDRQKKQASPKRSLPCWLNCRDSNPEYQNQNLMCYRYTTVQSDARKRDKDTQFFSIGNPVPLFSPGCSSDAIRPDINNRTEPAPNRRPHGTASNKRPPRKVFPAEPPRTSLSRKPPTPVWP